MLATANEGQLLRARVGHIDGDVPAILCHPPECDAGGVVIAASDEVSDEQRRQYKLKDCSACEAHEFAEGAKQQVSGFVDRQIDAVDQRSLALMGKSVRAVKEECDREESAHQHMIHPQKLRRPSPRTGRNRTESHTRPFVIALFGGSSLMSLLLKALALKLIAGRTVGGVFGLLMLLLVPMAGILKFIGIPLLVVLALLGAPLFLILGAIGLPALFVVGIGGALLLMLGVALALGAIAIKIALPIFLVVWFIRWLRRPQTSAPTASPNVAPGLGGI